MRLKNLAVPTTALVLASFALTACGGSASGSGESGDGDEIGIGYFQSSTVGPEVLVAGNPELADKIDGKLKLTPIDSGVAGLAQLRGGAFPFVSGVGNPPVTGAIAQDTKLKVIYALYYDAAQLIVPPSIKTDDDLKGKTVGALQGSSEDFEIRGWLEKKGLTDDVKVVGFPSEAAIGAAYKAGKIDAGYLEIAQAQDLVNNHDGRAVTNAEEIAKLGYPSVNVLAVTDDYAAKNKATVQQVVCQIMHAQALVKGPDAEDYITKAAAIVGAPAEQAVAATGVLPFIPADEQASILEKGGSLASSYQLTGDFLIDQGRITTPPTAEQIESHIDGSYAAQALKDGCDQ